MPNCCNACKRSSPGFGGRIESMNRGRAGGGHNSEVSRLLFPPASYFLVNLLRHASEWSGSACGPFDTSTPTPISHLPVLPLQTSCCRFPPPTKVLDRLGRQDENGINSFEGPVFESGKQAGPFFDILSNASLLKLARLQSAHGVQQRGIWSQESLMMR